MANIWGKAISIWIQVLVILCNINYIGTQLLQLYNQAHLLIIIFFLLDLIEDDPKCRQAWSEWWIITKYVAMGGLGLLALWEIMQFVGKVVTCEIKEYFFSSQNAVDLLMISLSATFFILETIEHCPLHKGSKYINSIY